MKMNKVIGILAFIVAFVLFRFLGLVGLFFLAAYFIGIWISNWIIKKGNVDGKLAKWLAWSNVVTWFIPLVGILTVAASYNFSNTKTVNKQTYRNLALLGLLLTLINAIWGTLQRLNG